MEDIGLIQVPQAVIKNAACLLRPGVPSTPLLRESLDLVGI